MITGKTTNKLNLSNGDIQAYRTVLKFIMSLELRHGDQLPGHDFLRSNLKLGNNTLSKAMQLMNSDGVVSSKNRSKTTLIDINKASIPLFNIAVIQPERLSGISAIYHLYLRQALAKRHCCVLNFFLEEKLKPRNTGRDIDISDIQRLPIAISSQSIDAVINTDRITGTKTPVMQFGSEARNWGVNIDIHGMIQAAVTELQKRGCKHLAIISNIGNFKHPSVMNYPITNNGLEAKQGMEIVKDLLSKPEALRPDGIICSDDYVTQGVTAGIATNTGWQPLIAARVNQQLKLPFFLPVISYVLNAEKLMETSAEILLDGLLSNGRNKQLLKITHHSVEETIEYIKLKILE